MPFSYRLHCTDALYLQATEAVVVAPLNMLLLPEHTCRAGDAGRKSGGSGGIMDTEITGREREDIEVCMFMNETTNG